MNWMCTLMGSFESGSRRCAEDMTSMHFWMQWFPFWSWMASKTTPSNSCTSGTSRAGSITCSAF